MPKNKGTTRCSLAKPMNLWRCFVLICAKLTGSLHVLLFKDSFFLVGKGGKNRRKGKNESDGSKRELIYKDEGQGNVESDLVGRHMSIRTLGVSCSVCAGYENAWQRQAGGILL